MEKIKAVVFDWGGVLAKNIFQDIMTFVSRELGVKKEDLIPVFNRHHHNFIIGEKSEDDFWTDLCHEMNIKAPEKGSSLIRQAFEAVYRPKSKVQMLLKEIQATKTLTGLLSDAELPSIKYYYNHVHPLFDAVVFSAMVGTEKPEQKIYELLINELGVRPEEVIFFDDRIENVEAANAFGIKAFQITEAEEIRDILNKYKILK